MNSNRSIARRLRANCIFASEIASFLVKSP